jgi:gas vesicle protein
MDNNTQSPSSGLGLGIAGLVLGIIALPLAIWACTSVSGLVLAILGVALSSVGYSQARKVNAPTSLIMAGLVVSIIGASFAMLRLSNSMMKMRKFPCQEISAKIEHKIENDTNEFEQIFKEEFEKELGGNMEDVLKELEGELDQLDNELDSIDIKLENLTDEEKASRLGKASGKALRKFIDEISDSTSSEK